MISAKVMMLAIGAVVLLLLIAVPTIGFALNKGRRLQVGAPTETRHVALKVGIALFLLLLALAGLVAFGVARGAPCDVWRIGKGAECECAPCCEEVQGNAHVVRGDEPGLPQDTQGSGEVTH